jgi:hypothetical protein
MNPRFGGVALADFDVSGFGVFDLVVAPSSRLSSPLTLRELDDCQNNQKW